MIEFDIKAMILRAVAPASVSGVIVRPSVPPSGPLDDRLQRCLARVGVGQLPGRNPRSPCVGWARSG